MMLSGGYFIIEKNGRKVSDLARYKTSFYNRKNPQVVSSGEECCFLEIKLALLIAEMINLLAYIRVDIRSHHKKMNRF